jgi:hypothetical protein
MANEPTQALPPGISATPVAGGAGALPAGISATPTPAASGAAPTLAPTEQERDAAGEVTGWAGKAKSFASNAWDEAKGLATGIGQAVTAPPQTPIDKALHVMGTVTGTEPLALRRLLVDPAIAKGKSTVQALRSGEWMKAGLGAVSTLDPVAPDVTKLYEQSASGDTAGAAGRGATDIAALKFGDTMGDLSKLLARAPTIEQGKIGYVNMARAATDKLDNAVRNTGVGARVKQVTDTDALDLQRTQSAGKVNGVAATQAMQNVINNTRLGGVAHGFSAQMTMADAKATMTQLGREASRLDRTGKSPEAASVWAAYDALRDETMNRASALDAAYPGQGHAKAWGDYAKEFKNYLGLQSGVLGHLIEGEHSASLNKLIEHSGQLPELQKWFDKYGIDFSPIKDAAEQGKKLNDLSQHTSNLFVSKLRGIYRYPLKVGAPVAAATIAGHAVGGLLGGIVLPLLVAGKVVGLLDRAQIHTILMDAAKHIPPDMMQVTGDPLGPHTPPPAGSAPTSLPAAGPAPGGPAGPTAGGPPATGAGGGAGGVPGAPSASGRSASGMPRANIPPSPFGQGLGQEVVERRGAPSGSYSGPERRTQAMQDYEKNVGETPRGQQTPGEKLAEQVRQARASKPHSITEGEALHEIMRDPAKYERYKDADQKARDTMLVKAKNELAARVQEARQR